MLFTGNRFRGPFVPLLPGESIAAFTARMREREKRVPFRRWRPVWEVQLLPQIQQRLDDAPGAVVYLAAYSSLLRRDKALAEAKVRAAADADVWVRVIDVGTGNVVFSQHPPVTRKVSVQSR